MDRLRAEARRSNGHRLYDQETFTTWSQRRWLFRPVGLLRLMVELFFEELAHAAIRLHRKTYEWHRDSTDRHLGNEIMTPSRERRQPASAD